MSCMKSLSIKIYIFLLCLSTQLSGQEMWPGDINNNGIVNGVDILYLGLGFATNGVVRPGGDSDWEAQTIAPWAQDFPDGINFAYGDCNGDGTIDEDDLEVIEDNFTLTHGSLSPDSYANGNAGQAPAISLIPSQTVAFPGQSLTVDVLLGNESFPVGDFYGISFTLEYDQEFIEPGDEDNFDFDLTSGNWIDPDENNSIYNFYNDEDTGEGDLAISRTDQNTVSGGMGKIGEFSIVIEDIIVGLEIDTLNIRIKDIKLIDVDLNTFPVVRDSVEIIIAKDSSFLTSNQETIANHKLNIYPIPAKDELIIETELEITDFYLFNTIGQAISFNQDDVYDRRRINLPTRLPSGTYCLKLVSPEGIITRKILIQSH